MDDVDDFIPASFHAELKSAASPLSSTSPLSANSAPAPQSWNPHFGSHANGLMPMGYMDGSGAPHANAQAHAPSHSAPHTAFSDHSAHAPSQSAPGSLPPMQPGHCYSNDAHDADMSRSVHNGFAQMSAHMQNAHAGPESAPQLVHQRHSASYVEVRTRYQIASRRRAQ